MSYAISLQGDVPCSEQHKLYKAAKAENDVLAARLSAEAADCHARHAKYRDDLAVFEAAQAERKSCEAQFSVYTQQKQAADVLAAQYSACQAAAKKYKDSATAYAAALAEYQALATQIAAQNNKLKADYDAAVAKYNTDFAAWTARRNAYAAYASKISAIQAGVLQQWSQIKSSYPSTQNYNFTRTSLVCGIPMPCMSAAWKKSMASQCLVLKGLGATDAGNCEYYRWYPTCPEPTVCPTPMPAPGPAPVLPSPPQYQTMPTRDAFLASKGVTAPVGTAPVCGDPQPFPVAPSCSLNTALPSAPSQPGCEPPAIPPAPVAPTCKPSMFEGVSGLWLLLAAGGVGWYLLKKSK